MTSPSSAGGRHFASGSTVTVDLTGLLLAGELLYARTALAAWARVANIDFVETTGAAQITMTDDNDAINYNAYTSTMWTNSTTISSASIHITQKWYNANGGAGGPTGVLNSYGYQTYVHELGHALGLGHDGPYNGTASYGTNNIFTNDSWQFSTMSYFDQTNYGGASYAYITSAMQADIYGIQLLYGAPPTDPGTHKFGYGADTGSEFDLAQSNSFCIYSANGTADLDASLYGGAQTVNFNAGTFSSIKGLINNVSTAINTYLTSYEGGSGIDNITLTSLNVDDRIDGGAGSDTVNVVYNFNSGYKILAGSTANGLVLISTNGHDILTNVEFVHFADGTTVSTASLVGSTATFKTASDYNGNRISDILFRNAATGDTGFDQVNANGTLQGWRSICSSNTSYAVAGTGDYNGDGISDVLFRNNATGDMGFCQLNSNGTLQGWHALGSSNSLYTVVGTGDFNGDGVSDILFRNSATGDTGFDQVNASGTLQRWHSICSSNTSYAVAGTGDYNGDGISDVLFRNNATGDMGFCQLNSNGTLQGWHALGGSVTSYGVF